MGAQQGISRTFIIGGADLLSTGLSSTSEAIREGVAGSTAYNYNNSLDYDHAFVQKIVTDVRIGYSRSQIIQIYGYSKGGEIALKVSRQLHAIGVHVNLLVTVDAANGPWSRYLDRSVPSSVGVNINFYQTVPGTIIPSYGGPNTGSSLIVNQNMTGPGVTHSNIDELTMQTVINLLNR